MKRPASRVEETDMAVTLKLLRLWSNGSQNFVYEVTSLTG